MSLNGEDVQNPNPNPIEKARPFDPNSGAGSKPKPGNPRISYRECLKNHAANIGGTVTDGCGEFMPCGDDGTLEALKCAACGCHRNFHRKEYYGADMLHLTPPPPSMSHHRHPHWAPSAQPVKMAYAGTDSSSEELNFNPFSSGMVAPPPPQFAGRKRFRTKFTVEQKEKMVVFAEKIGWRIPREDDSELQRFCAEVGVKRQVFKVWMHNNKISSASKKTSTTQHQHDF